MSKPDDMLEELREFLDEEERAQAEPDREQGGDDEIFAVAAHVLEAGNLTPATVEILLDPLPPADRPGTTSGLGPGCARSPSGAGPPRQSAPRRLAEGPAGFSLHVQLAEAGDPTHDSTRSWPSDRSEIVAGRLEVTAPVDDQLAGCEHAIFDPTRVTAGIECSNDPVLNFRARAYSVSYERRSH